MTSDEWAVEVVHGVGGSACLGTVVFEVGILPLRWMGCLRVERRLNWLFVVGTLAVVARGEGTVIGALEVTAIIGELDNVVAADVLRLRGIGVLDGEEVVNGLRFSAEMAWCWTLDVLAGTSDFVAAVGLTGALDFAVWVGLLLEVTEGSIGIENDDGLFGSPRCKGVFVIVTVDCVDMLVDGHLTGISYRRPSESLGKRGLGNFDAGVVLGDVAV